MSRALPCTCKGIFRKIPLDPKNFWKNFLPNLLLQRKREGNPTPVEKMRNTLQSLRHFLAKMPPPFAQGRLAVDCALSKRTVEMFRWRETVEFVLMPKRHHVVALRRHRQTCEIVRILRL